MGLGVEVTVRVGLGVGMAVGEEVREGVGVGVDEGVELGVEGAVGDGVGLLVGDDTGVTGLVVEVGTSSGWQANRNNPAARASMTTVVIVRTGPVRSVELCSFKHPCGEIQIWRGSGKCIMRLLH